MDTASPYAPAAPTSYPVAVPAMQAPQHRLRAVWYLLVIAALVAAIPFSLHSDSLLRVLVAASIFLPLYACRTASNRIFLVFLYLSIMGGLRRWMIPAWGFPNVDLLLLIVPTLTFLRFFTKAFSRQLPLDTRLSRLLLWLLAIMALEIFNPLQGGLEVGFAGAMYYMVPILWYFEAREAASEETAGKCINLMIGVTLIGIAYATYQYYYGFTVGEVLWAKTSTNLSSTMSGVVLPMSFFSHRGEYVRFVGMVCVLLFAMWVHRRNIAALLPLPVLMTLVFLSGSRGAILTILSIGAAFYAVKGPTMRSWIPRGMVALALAIAGLVFSLNQIDPGKISGTNGEIAQRQKEGLLNPLDSNKSTAQIHSQMALSGFTKAFRQPLGTGLGSTTLAAQKFSGNVESTEVDVTNLFTSLGPVGGIIYICVACLFIGAAFRLWDRTRSWVSLCLLGVVLFFHLQWLNTGLYAQTMFIWVCIGFVDGLAHREGLT